jgi:peptidoglycan glycosyltransferase
VNRSLKRISIAVLALFLLLMINLNYVQGFDTTALANLPFNTRTLASQQQYKRGNIETSDGLVIAESNKITGNSEYKYTRYYPDAEVYAPVTGYNTIFGTSTGLENAYNSYLSGQSSSLAVRNIIDEITNKAQSGATVVTTINSKAQEAAYQGLKSVLAGTNRVGGVVAINYKTGAILAMASYPSYDTNNLASLDGTAVNSYDKQLLAENPDPLLNNATESTFPPGSTFKIVTSSTWFTQSSNNTPNSKVSSPTQLSLPQTNHILNNDNDSVCGNGSGTTTLITAFAESCDTTFANLGMQLGTGPLNSQAEKFGFNQSLSLSGISAASSQYTMAASEAETAMTAIGQFDDTVSALQEAMLSAAIANGGTLMKPYLVQEVQASDLSVVNQTTPSVLSQAVSPSVASNVETMMEAVVNQSDGTANGVTGTNGGTSIHDLGVQIAAKTGTAQNGVNSTGLNDAVFTCFSTNPNDPIAVGVIVEGGGFGAAAAAPVAVDVLQAYLGSK